MPEGAFLPPWLQPADPAAHMATGLQIGVRIGAEQAAQQLQQAQMLRQEQIQAQEQARWQAEFGLREAEAKRTAEAAARKSAAIAAYQQEVASGADPLSAILRYGPAMQEPGSAMAAAYRSMIPKKQVQPKIPKWVPPDPETGQPGMLVDESTGGLLAHYPIQKESPDVSPSERAQTLKQLDDQRKEVLDEFPLLMTKAKRLPDKLTPEEKDALRRIGEIDAQKKRLLPLLGQPVGGAKAPGQTIRFVRDPQTGQLVMEGQPAAPSLAAPALSPEAQPMIPTTQQGLQTALGAMPRLSLQPGSEAPLPIGGSPY